MKLNEIIPGIALLDDKDFLLLSEILEASDEPEILKEMVLATYPKLDPVHSAKALLSNKRDLPVYVPQLECCKKQSIAEPIDQTD